MYGTAYNNRPATFLAATQLNRLKRIRPSLKKSDLRGNIESKVFKHCVSVYCVAHSVCRNFQATSYHTVFYTPQFDPNSNIKNKHLKSTQVLKILVSVVRFRPRAPLLQDQIGTLPMLCVWAPNAVRMRVRALSFTTFSSCHLIAWVGQETVSCKPKSRCLWLRLWQFQRTL